MDNVALLDVAVDLELDAVNLVELNINDHISQNIVDLFPEAPGVVDAVENTIRLEPGRTLLHKNLMHYLTLAWYNHFSVVISPDMIFYTILCELAEEIKKQPDSYRHLFTDSTDKKQILTVSNNDAKLDLNQVISALSKNIAVDASLFTAEFSTTNNESRLAIQAAFCDAMSPYYYYSRSRCGIPRIKVLGTKQDWHALEQKLYRMATEVFNNEIRSSKEVSLAEYLNRVHEIVQKIQTDNIEFWKDMYKIDKCRSGHTNFVRGWINKLYVSNSGNDFYNYESHISLVSYKDLDNQKEYELRCGLLFSSIEQNTADELDQKYPWLVPHFAHVILDKSVKMTDEQYKNYINKALTGDDYVIFREFFDVLKDKPMFLVSGYAEKIKQRLEIVGRQIDHWTAHPDLTDKIDFSESRFREVFWAYQKPDLNAAMEVLLQKLKKCFDMCQIRSVNLGDSDILTPYEEKIIRLLIGNANLEELTLVGYNEEKNSPAIIALCDLLSDPNCRLKSIKITQIPIEGHIIAISKALLNLKSPIENIELHSVVDNELADVIFELATKRSLKRLYCQRSNNIESNRKILLAIAQSRTLEDAQLFSLGEDGPKDIFEELTKNLHQNTNLKALKVIGHDFNKDLLSPLLSIPSLTKLDLQQSTDFGFLSRTPLLQHMKASGSDSKLVEFLQSDTCQLQHLEFSTSNAFLEEFGAGLLKNKSLQHLHVSIHKDKNAPHNNKFGELLATALENKIPLRSLELNDYLRIGAESMEYIVKALVYHPYLETLQVGASDVTSEQGMEHLIELVKTNKTLKRFYIFNYYTRSSCSWTEEQKKRLIEALEQSDTLTGFYTTEVYSSQFTLKNEPRF